MTQASLVVADHDHHHLNPATAKTVAAASHLTPNAVHIWVSAAPDAPPATEAAQLAGVTQVWTTADLDPEQATATSVATHVTPLVNEHGYHHVLGPNTTFGKDVLPRLAAVLGRPMVTDLSEIFDTWRYSRPIYAGNATAHISAASASGIVASIRTASFTEAGTTEQPGCVSAAPEPTNAPPEHARVVTRQSSGGNRPDLQNADRVVVGGRGLGSAANFERVFEFADAIGAAVGASRAAVDADYAPNEFQVGQTGRIIAPSLYIGLGVSGAIQHLAGIKDAGTIVAINNDPDAPIFEIADIGLVADLFEVLPRLQTAFGAATTAQCEVG
ncbi:electron transfer flavoprotein subunit alpha/FixB family protein [Salinisphaera sp. USBA-960]|uniref:electron transfer flavoprotein subunit alpha/FixB family protein n=1 Tax=Salinisphaera orenii TaxID=856731 RepID=UPI000DBEA0C2|nr:electron transfer flavoprotein subunit alpha/FixB family protein [Salifodinibacter halophilus]NNC25680.1 electron transfer flavoprotein subunit alpha/FixB family protein [Salifodinibacter halophilus]